MDVSANENATNDAGLDTDLESDMTAPDYEYAGELDYDSEDYNFAPQTWTGPKKLMGLIGIPVSGHILSGKIDGLCIISCL
jgi:hypothetical protein